MTGTDRLASYAAKRDFARTPEPGLPEAGPREGVTSDAPIFVVQKHQARRLHFDLRLEIEGVLASWAVPKGPSLRPKDKRLAIRTEDHPLAYSHFEGVIPEGAYGAGRMIVWDHGSWENRSLDDDGRPIALEAALTHGKAEFVLHGRRLRGAFKFVRPKAAGPNQWLLIKRRDEHAADLDVSAAHSTSLLSGRTLEALEPENQ